MSHSRDRILTALAGGATCVAGLTFVADEAIAGLRWGQQRPIRLLEAACSALDPDFIFVPAGLAWSDEAVDRVLGCGPEVMWVVDGPLGTIAAEQGWMPLLRQTVSEPDAAGEAFDLSMPSALEAVRRGARLGASAIVIAEDLGGPSGPLVSPDFTLDHIIPRLGMFAQEAAGAGLPAVLHADGDMRVFLSALRHEGFAGIHPGSVPTEEFPALYETVRASGLAVLGGIGGDVLRAGGPAVETAVSHAAVLGAGGGLLFADDGGISEPAELASMVTAIARYRSAFGG
jgi:hypothetical protein